MASYAHYCLHEFHLMPWDFYKLSLREKAFLIASIDTRAERLKEEQAKIKTK